VNRPSLFTYIIGSPISLLAVWLLTAFLAYQWYANGGPGVLPIITGITAIAASNAYQRIDSYRLWKREWDAMNGVTATGTVTGDLMRKAGFRLLVGGAIWCAFAYAALTVGTPTGRAVAGLFWIGTLLLIATGIYRLIRRVLPARSKANNVRDVPVTQCLKAPTQSPSVQQTLTELPDYCRPLFADRPEPRAPIAR